MLKPIKMQKIRIIGLKSILSPLIKELHEAGLIEIKVIDYSASGLEQGRPLEVFNALSEKLVRLRAVKAMMIKQAEDWSNPPTSYDIRKEEIELEKLERELKGLTEENVNIKSEILRLKNELHIVEELTVFDDIDFSQLETRMISYIVGDITTAKVDECRKKLDKIVENYNIRIEEDKKNKKEKIRCLLIYKKGNYDISELLSDLRFSRIQVPVWVTYPKHTMDKLRHELENSEKRQKEINATLNSFSKQHYKKILALEKLINIEAERAEITSRFNFTKSAFIIEGWVKSKNLEELERIVGSTPDTIIESVETEHHEIAPTVLDNPKYASQFQYITESFSFPNSRELDPTMIYFITLPLFYGMIVGDVIYGLISIFLAKWFMNNFKNEMLVNAAKIWYFSACFAIFFGLVFDEWFGVPHAYWFKIFEKWGISLEAIGVHGALYKGLHRVFEFTTLLVITIVVGLFHLALGFIIAAYNEWNHNRKHAYGKLAWLGTEIGGTFAIAGFVGALPSVIGTVGIALLVLSLIGLVLTEGFVGILEVPGLMGNALSYTRIAAVGVVGVMLAEVINMLLVPMPSYGIFAILLIPIFIILHVINTLIVMIEALIQGGRLNIVEFRSKFLHGGGKIFKPFSVK